MKNRREHIVPLSRQCLDGLENQENGHDWNEFVFTSIPGGPPSDLLTHLDRQPSDTIDRPPTVHGFRATFMQWGAETGEDERLLDWSLSHDDKTRVERAYNRSAVLQRRRELLQRWADYVAPTGFGGNFS